VAIAKDVLAQLRSKRYIAEEGDYVDFSNWSDINEEEDIQSNFNTIKECKVCALGSAALSCIKYTNNSSFEDAQYQRENFWDQLLKVFTKKELVLMEYAFEGFKGDSSGKANDWKVKLPYKLIDKTLAFCEKYKNQNKRLKAIMKNIIENEGKFIL